MHNLLGSLQIWEQRRFTQKSCVQLSKYSTVTSQAYNIIISCFYVHVASNPFLEIFPYFSVLPDYLHSKTFILFILMLFTYILKSFCIYNSVQLCIPRHFFPLSVHQGPNSQSLTGGIKSTTLCHSRPYPQERYQEFNYRSSTLLSGRLRGLQDDGEKAWDFS